MKPLLGVCLGFQCMVVEHCRTVLGWEGANSTECDEATAYPVVIFMPEVNKKGMSEQERKAQTVCVTYGCHLLEEKSLITLGTGGGG